MRATGSERETETFRSGFSTLVYGRTVTEPEPMSPWHENLTPSLVASIVTRQGI